MKLNHLLIQFQVILEVSLNSSQKLPWEGSVWSSKFCVGPRWILTALPRVTRRSRRGTTTLIFRWSAWCYVFKVYLFITNSFSRGSPTNQSPSSPLSNKMPMPHRLTPTHSHHRIVSLFIFNFYFIMYLWPIYPVQSLPEDCLGLILDHMDPVTVAQLEKTNKHM